jgi:hypothetical protein
MLNAYLTFSWPNKVPFDHEARDTIQARIDSGWQTGAEGRIDGDVKSESKVRPSSHVVPGYYGPWLLSRDVYLKSVIGDL